MAALPHPAQPSVRPRLVRLSDDLRVWSPGEAEAVMLWRSITPDSAYAQAAARLRPGDNVLDIGANVGLTSIYCSRVQPGIRVLAAEPAPAVFDCLRRNLTQYLATSDSVQVAVSDRVGAAQLTYSPHAPCNSTLAPDHASEDENSRMYLRNSGLNPDAIDTVVASLHQGVELSVPTTTVSQLLRDYQTARVGLLKVDVEGAELEVLAGVTEADWGAIDQVVVEVHDEQNRVDQIRALLRGHGLVVDVRQDATLAGTNLYELAAVRLQTTAHAIM